ncbi:MAG: hypothetical protein NT129_04765 [Candidatus Aenigmarchaeota archaeon]|nr:hypothetical protein [Candidatus Aenigmarchaeota archaeon]
MVAHIFRSYDVRGIYKKDLTDKTMEGIGKALGHIARENVAVGMDMRTSSPKLREAFIKGVTAKNKVYDLGLAPMGAAMFYAWRHGLMLAYITASHLPKEWNGVKFFHADGIGFVEEENFRVRDIFLSEKNIKGKEGRIALVDNNKANNDYKTYLLSKIRMKKKLRIVIDCGNGMASIIAPQLFREARCEVFTIFDKLDGTFPNRDPEPTAETISELKKEVKKRKADIGIAYDGDADRMLIVDDKARVVVPEQIAYFVLSELLKKESGPIVANVECTKAVDDVALQYNRKVFRIRVGHPYLVKEAKKRKAAFGLESAGHFVLPSLVPFDDALAVSFYAVSVLSRLKKKLSSIVDEIPSYFFERINFNCADEKKFGVIEKLKTELKKEYPINEMDGIRIDFPEGWILIRASNTGPIIRLTVEGKTKKGFDELKKRFNEKLRSGLAVT